MSEQPDESTDKSHEPTAKKRQDAAKKGDVPRAPDVYTALAYAGLVASALMLGDRLMLGIGDLGTWILRSSAVGGITTDAVLREVVLLMVPVFLFPMGLVLAAGAAQGHLRPVGSKLKPKLSRISVISNGKQRFGARGLAEFLKSTAKLTAACAILAILAYRDLPEIAASALLSPGAAMLFMFALAIDFMVAILVLTAVIAVADTLWQQADWTRRNRMSHKDLRDESKEAEGSPEMKGRRRQRGEALVSSGMVQAVREADVVVVNPEHYAVALAWDRARDSAPRCVAKGVDEIAMQMRRIARENAVPIHADPPTARALHGTLQVGQEIHPDHFRPVAAAIRFADALRARQRASDRWTT